MRKCGCIISDQERAHADQRWRAAAFAAPSTSERVLDTFLDVGVAIHFDIDVKVLPLPTKDFAMYLVSNLNDVYQLRTDDYLYWSSLTIGSMSTAHGLPSQVATAVHDFLHVPVALSPRIRFVLRQVAIRPNSTGTVVDPMNSAEVVDLKTRRLPYNPSLFNIWVTTLSNGLLGVAEFPFTESFGTYGAMVDYRSTDPQLAGSTYQLFSYNRTMAHEVGHCMGLFHVFTNPNKMLTSGAGGALPDAPDGDQWHYGDGAEDTPRQQTPTSGDPLNEWDSYQDVYNDEGDVVAFVNVLDYTADRSMMVLSANQVRRMEFFFQNDVRERLVTDVTPQSTAIYDDLPPPPSADRVELLVLGGDYVPPSGFQWNASTVAGVTVACVLIVVAIIVIIYFITLKRKNAIQ